MGRRSSALVLAVLVPVALQAQDAVRLGGVLRDSAGKPVGDVGVLVMPGNLHARSGASGEFSVALPRAADYYMSIRRLGFEPVNQIIRIAGDTVMQLTLARRPQMLDTVVVAKECSRVRFSGFLCRRTKGQGVFLTEADILAKNPEYLADLFMGMPDFHVEPVITPYGQGREVRTTQSRCLIELVDGRPPITRRHKVESARLHEASASTTTTLENYYGPDALIGVEIYPPGYDTPDEYMPIARVAIERGGQPLVPGTAFNTTPRQVKGAEERCVLINYWTSGALPKARKSR